MLQSKEEHSLGELFSQLTREMSALVRQEVELAKTEMTEKATAAVKGIAFVVVAGCFAFVAFQALVAAAILALAQVGVAPWLAAVIVGLVLAVIAAILLAIALPALKKAANPTPQRTVETIKEDVQWAKEQIKR